MGATRCSHRLVGADVRVHVERAGGHAYIADGRGKQTHGSAANRCEIKEMVPHAIRSEERRVGKEC